MSLCMKKLSLTIFKITAKTLNQRICTPGSEDTDFWQSWRDDLASIARSPHSSLDLLTPTHPQFRTIVLNFFSLFTPSYSSLPSSAAAASLCHHNQNRKIVRAKPDTGLYIANCPFHVSRWRWWRWFWWWWQLWRFQDTQKICNKTKIILL